MKTHRLSNLTVLPLLLLSLLSPSMAHAYNCSEPQIPDQELSQVIGVWL
jgi:hypothetical protein